MSELICFLIDKSSLKILSCNAQSCSHVELSLTLAGSQKNIAITQSVYNNSKPQTTWPIRGGFNLLKIVVKLAPGSLYRAHKILIYGNQDYHKLH